MIVKVFFFFSSRRRHTRLQGDWGSDVCSSDLARFPAAEERADGRGRSRGMKAERRDFLLEIGTEELPPRALFALQQALVTQLAAGLEDRKSTRLNSSHLVISYAVFCLKKKMLITI